MRADPALGEPLHPELPYGGGSRVGGERGDGANGRRRAGAPHPRAVPQRPGRVGMAPRVAALLAREQRRDAAWQASEVERFAAVAAGYVAG